MTTPYAKIVRFPPRRSPAIWITREDSAWLVLAGVHGWLLGSRADAREAANWLAQNHGLPVREAAS